MISVPSRLRLLSGNSLMAVCLMAALFASCGGTDRVVSRTPKKRTVEIRTPKDTPTSNKVDTVQWTEATNPRKPPFTDVESERSSLLKEDVYDITYLLPFDALGYTSSSNVDDKFIQYFAGMQMAKEILERENVFINVNVADSEKRSIEQVLASEVSADTDAIVGLWETSDLKKAADYAKEKQIPLISPWKASAKIAAENPYYVQLRPNLDEYYKTIVKDIASKYKPEQVYVLGRESAKDVKMVKYIQRLGEAYFRSDEPEPFTSVLVDQDSLAFGETAFDSIFYNDPTHENVVIIPNWSFGDESFIYGCARKLSVERGPSKMIVYGLEVMLDSDKITFDHYSTLNMRVARTKFVDESDGDVQRFKKRFVEVFGALPTADAYEGYDNLMFIGRNIFRYGKNFQHHLEKDRDYYLQAAYDVQKTFPKGSKDDSFRDIDYFENKHIDIISFDGRRFVRIVN